VKVPAWLLYRHQIRAGDLLDVRIQNVRFDVKLGKDFRFTIPKREYEAIKKYWLNQPVIEVYLEFEERPEARLVKGTLGDRDGPFSE